MGDRDRPKTAKAKKEKNQNVQVVVRLRKTREECFSPINEYERADQGRTVVQVSEGTRVVNVRDKTGTKTFSNFDKVYGQKASQAEIYRDVAEELIGEVLQGYNCTVFAYGQTGTGKTYTMEGEHDANGEYSWDKDPKAGIIPRAMHHLFSELDKQEAEEFSVRVSYVELYNEELFDLLGAVDLEQAKLRIFEDPMRKGSVVINGMEEVAVRSRDEVYQVLRRGAERRKTATTLLNLNSSRSHSVFTITVVVRENTLNGEELLKQGKLHLVDLAGSECIGRSGAVDKRAREAGNINQSLLTLGRVITSLTSNAPHVPYRESKLTRLLQDSLGGRTITTIVATITPSSTCLEETLSTLEYAQRAKNIKNHPEINQKLSRRALLKEYNDEIERLRRDLLAARDKNGVFLAVENYENMQQRLAAQDEKIDELEGQLTGVLKNLQNLMEDTEMMDEQYQRAYRHLQEARAKLQRRRLESEDFAHKLMETTDQLEETRFMLKSSQDAANQLHNQAVQCHDVCTAATGDLAVVHGKLDGLRLAQAKNRVKMDEFEKSALGLGDKCGQISEKSRDDAQKAKGKADAFVASVNKESESFVEAASGKLTKLGADLSEICSDLVAMLQKAAQRSLKDNQDFDGDLAKLLKESEVKVNAMCTQSGEQLKSVADAMTFLADRVDKIARENALLRDENSRLLAKHVENTAAVAAKFETEKQAILQRMQEFVSRTNDLMSEQGSLAKELETDADALMADKMLQVGGLVDECRRTSDVVRNDAQNLGRDIDEKRNDFTQHAKSTSEAVAKYVGNLGSRVEKDLESTADSINCLNRNAQGQMRKIDNDVGFYCAEQKTTIDNLQKLLDVQEKESRESMVEIEAGLAELKLSIGAIGSNLEMVTETGGTPKPKTYAYPVELISVPSADAMRWDYEQQKPPSTRRYRPRESILDADASLLLSPDALKSTLPSQRANNSLPRINENGDMTPQQSAPAVSKSTGGARKPRQ